MAHRGRAELGWGQAGSTDERVRGPFETWASMPQLIDAEEWPAGDRQDDRLLLPHAGGPGLPTSPARVPTASSARGAPQRRRPRRERHRRPAAGRQPRGGSAGSCCAVRRPPARRCRPSSSPPTSTRRIATSSRSPGPTVPAQGRRERLRQPVARRRLDRQRLERGVHRGGLVSGLQAANAVPAVHAGIASAATTGPESVLDDSPADSARRAMAGSAHCDTRRCSVVRSAPFCVIAAGRGGSARGPAHPRRSGTASG